jgi:hypothetical protein
MARPGLEPGTPRFSVVDRNLSNSGVIPAVQWFLRVAGSEAIIAICVRLPPIWALKLVPVPNRLARRVAPFPASAQAAIRPPCSASSALLASASATRSRRVASRAVLSAHASRSWVLVVAADGPVGGV